MAAGSAPGIAVGSVPVGVVIDGTGGPREAMGGNAAMSPGSGGHPQSTPASGHDPFAELDAAPGAVTWTHAGPRQAEAGFEDPVLGWVGVRAEVSSGGVHAELVPGSAGAAQELGRQIEGLHTYLTEQRTPVESLSVAFSGGRGGDQATDQQMQQNQQQQGSGRHAGTDAEPIVSVGREGFKAANAPDQTHAANPQAALDLREGSRISVMA